MGAEDEDNSMVFVILCHARNDDDYNLLERAYNSVRQFYKSTKIVIIDDNSKIEISDHVFPDVTVVKSEFPGAGELLPYYYFLKYQWADKMIFIHDSMFLIRKFSDEEVDYPLRFHWYFSCHHGDDDQRINSLLSYLNHSNELISYNMNRKSRWNGCFGVASIIDLVVLQDIEEKYSMMALVDKIKCRDDRMALERIFGILAFKARYVKKNACSNCGCISGFPGEGRGVQISDGFWDEFKLTYRGALLKTWHSR